MKFQSRAKQATKDVLSAIQFSASPAQAKEVTRIIEQAMIDSYQECTEQNVHAAMDCCSEDKDLAHKIADEIRRANTALVANLSSLR
jgi:hypothetical protein